MVVGGDDVYRKWKDNEEVVRLRGMRLLLDDEVHENGIVNCPTFV